MICEMFGGPHDGEVIEDGGGVEMLFPFIDEQSNTEQAEWFAQYGIAKAWRDAGLEPWDGPPPPPIPRWVYTPVHIFPSRDRVIYAHAGIAR